MDAMDMGHDGSSKMAASTVTAGKPLKKKKSLPRLFILGSKKSVKSSAQSPQSAKDARPLPSTRTPSGSSAKGLCSNLNTGNVKAARMVDEQVLKETNGNARGVTEYSPRDMTGYGPDRSGGSLLDSGRYDMDPEPYDENEDIELRAQTAGIAQGSSWPLQSPIDTSIPRNRSRRRMENLTFSTPDRNDGVFKSQQPKPLQSAKILPPRPYTAVQPNFPDNVGDEAQHTPLRVGSARKANEEALAKRRSPTPEHWVRWKSSYIREDTQESIRSGLSSASSVPDTASTEHSSIFTKLSSVSGISIDLEEDQLPKHASMTVDDAIDLYSAGFEDDFGLPEEDLIKSPSEEEIRRRSFKIAEAMNDTIDSSLMLPPKLKSPETRDSTDIVSGEVFKSIFPHPPSIRSPDTTHDQYGFQKFSRDITIAQYDAWHTEYACVQKRRNTKWIAFMQDQGLPINNPTRFPDRSAKVQRFIRKGVPPAWRGAAWFYYAGGESYLLRHPDLYAELVLQSQTPKLDPADREAIERDLHRTFPDNIHFKPVVPSTPTTETPLLSSLRRVLSAFAIQHPRIGYCQSLNFLAGLLLLFLPEEKAFWLLHILTTTHLPGTHELSLEGANVDLWVLMLALKEAVPSIWAKVGGEVSASTTRLPPISLCTTSWFMSLFIGTLPIESVLRVWDVLFYEGSRTLFRVALAIFKLGEAEIKAVSDPMEIFQVVQGLPRKMLGVSELMGVACKRGGVAQAWVERKRAERKAWYAAQRGLERERKGSRKESEARRESEAKSAGENSMKELEVLMEMKEEGQRKRADSGWRGRIGLGFGRV
ncbi:hypothetical protein MMC11_005854 [Xylographa trunciseda]|nr:hypothetical protein [Xylographa trunciseda]